MDPHQPPLTQLLYFFKQSSPLQLSLVSRSIALSFTNYVSLLKARFILMSRPYAVCLLPHGVPLRSPSLFRMNFFFVPLLTFASSGWFPFLSVANITKLERFTKRVVAPSPAAYRLPLSLFTSPTSHPDSFRPVIL